MSKCKGPNCTAENGVGHSEECKEQYERITNPGGIYDEDPPELFPGTNEALDKLVDLEE